MYQVEVKVLLLGRDGTMGLSRSLRLPFAPFEGLGLHGITTDPEQAEMIVSVAWDVTNKRFRVELEEWCRSPEDSLSELIDYFGPEWDLREPGFEPVR